LLRQHIFEPRIPIRATKVPIDPDWLREIKGRFSDFHEADELL
jgi:hypothetical protein